VIGYDSQEEVYDLMFKELDFAVAVNKEWMQMKCQHLQPQTSLYIKQWVKFANSASD
jgi:hypothetical protein